MQTTSGAAPSPAVEDKTSLCFVIDTDVAFRQDFSNRLRGAGVDVVEFGNSARVLESLDDRIPDVIFLGVNPADPFDCLRALTALANSSFAGRVQLVGKCEPAFFESICKYGQHLSLIMLAPLKKPLDFALVRKVVRDQKLIQVPSGPSDLSLTQALAQNWVTFWYQPKVALRDKQLVGAEALVRFIHPQHGVMSPSHFLSGAREEDLLELAKRALRQALVASDNFARQGIEFSIALNLSVESLLKLPVAELMREHRSEHAAYVVMEISERQAINRIALLKAKSEELASCGISLALDHCGRGNSSFQMLNQIRFSEIKIDQSLVRDCDKDQARANVCRSIIQMAHNFSIKTTAVGIETSAEAGELAAQDCDFNQGYLFGKPMTQKLLMEMVLTSRSGAVKAASPAA
jgi:EAL domain-containing protein (putative c-di-GMP-specific phosphodiesterase class I)